ncbi:MAG: hypothetical protein IJ088_04680 [Clostridia bacterium]|nr:hypothetical protein [Clostridia bacterium]
MNKKFTVLMVAVLAAVMLVVSGMAEEDIFSRIQGKLFEFSSGAGAWSTELKVDEKGAFTGNFHDSEMGETGEGYPNGTVYGCSFHGQFSDPEKVDETTWKVGVKVEMDEGQVSEAIEDEIRYVTSAPYGLEKAQTVVIYEAGTPIEKLPEGFMVWSHLQEVDPDAKTLPYDAIWNETDEAGFVAIEQPANLQLTIAGGWTPAADPTITDAVQNLMKKGMEGLVGVSYVPVAYLGSQVVAGTNHAILCQATVVYPGAAPYFVIVYLYEDLQGNVTLMNIADFDVGMFCTYGAD